jgi:glycosyltransferase involved in cell wall biosynthesis
MGMDINRKTNISSSYSIAAKYQEVYGILPVVVRNFPNSTSGIIPFSRSELQVPETHLIIILQGGGINIDRGGEELVEAIVNTDNVVLFIIGSGDILTELKERVKLLNITDRVRFIPKMPWEEMMRYTKSSDAGLTLDKSTNLNYMFSLPNKLFDYISAGIAVIASDLPEVTAILMKCQCGIIIPEVNTDKVRRAVIKLRDDRVLLNKLKKNAVKASEYVSWANEKIKVAEFYSIILNGEKSD